MLSVPVMRVVNLDLSRKAPNLADLYGLSELEVEGFPNGYVPTSKENGLAMGDMILTRRNPNHQVVSRRYPGGNPRDMLYAATDPYAATWGMQIHAYKIVGENLRLHKIEALAQSVAETLKTSLSDADRRNVKAAILIIVSTLAGVRDEDKQIVLDQITAMANLQDSRGRENRMAFQARVTAAKAALTRRNTRLTRIQAANRGRTEWVHQQIGIQDGHRAELLWMLSALEQLPRDEHHSLWHKATMLCYKPDVLSLNHAYLHREEPEALGVLRRALSIFAPLYGVLYSPLSRLAARNNDAIEADVAMLTDMIDQAVVLLETIQVGGAFVGLFAELLGDAKGARSLLEDGNWSGARVCAKTYLHRLRYRVEPGVVTAPAEWYTPVPRWIDIPEKVDDGFPKGPRG